MGALGFFDDVAAACQKSIERCENLLPMGQSEQNAQVRNGSICGRLFLGVFRIFDGVLSNRIAKIGEREEKGRLAIRNLLILIVLTIS